METGRAASHRPATIRPTQTDAIAFIGIVSLLLPKDDPARRLPTMADLALANLQPREPHRAHRIAVIERLQRIAGEMTLD